MPRKLLLTLAVCALPAMPIFAGAPAVAANASSAENAQWISTATKAAPVVSVVSASRNTYVQPRYRAMLMHSLSTGGTHGQSPRVYEAAKNRGPLAARTALHLVVGLHLRNQDRLALLVKEESTPGNPLYGHYLTAAQSKAAFAPTSSEVQSVLTYLQRQGFTGLHVASNNLLITATGSAGQAEHAFHTRIDRFLRTEVNGALHRSSVVYSNVRVAQVPASLGGTVLSVIGLTNASSLQLHPSQLPGNVLTSYNAGQLQTAYDANGSENPANCLSLTGSTLSPTPLLSYNPCAAPKTAAPTGQTTITAIMASGYLGPVVSDTSGASAGSAPPDKSDLSMYEQHNNLPFEPVTIICTTSCAQIKQNATSTDTAYQGEWDLDTQTSSGIAGGVQHLYVYDTPAPLSDANVTLEFNRFQADNLAKAGSASYGGCESGSYLDGSMVQIDEALALATGQGQTMFASTGDTGGSCSIGIPNGVPAGAEGQVEYPASSPYVVGVGGTTLATNPDPNSPPAAGAPNAGCPPMGSTNPAPAQYTYCHEIPWYAGGGGPSLFEGEPSWQAPVVPPVSATCTVAYGACFGKGLPDISMDADPNTGAEVYTSGAFGGVGGTSLSSPLALGVLARLNSSVKAYLAANPTTTIAPSSTFSGLPFAAPLLYSFYTPSLQTPTGPTQPPEPSGVDPQPNTYPLHDITEGSNTPYAANPGYDFSTGLGSLDIAQLNYAVQHSLNVPAGASNAIPTVPQPACTTVSDTSPNDAMPLGAQSNNDALDIQAVGFASPTASNVLNIQGQMRLTNLSNGPGGTPMQSGNGNVYYVTFQYHGVTDFLQAQYSTSNPVVPTPNPTNPTDPNNFTTYSYGHIAVSPTGGKQFTTDGAATGHVDQANNLITIMAPASGFTFQQTKAGTVAGGTAPAAGSVLAATGGLTQESAGTAQVGGFLEQADSVGPGANYTVGASCTNGKPTAARVSRATVQRHQHSLVFHWTMSANSAVIGFNLYSGGHRLNRAIIPVHSASHYTYRTSYRASGRYTLHLLLRNGGQTLVSIS